MKKVVLFFALIFECTFLFGFDAIKSWDEFYRVKNLLNDALAMEKDINGDGRITCIDNAIIFYNLWVARYGKNTVRLVVNRNPNPSWDYEGPYVLNHIYAQVFVEKHWVKIETTGRTSSLYVEDAWDEKYDPKYDIYDEQDYWIWRSAREKAGLSIDNEPFGCRK